MARTKAKRLLSLLLDPRQAPKSKYELAKNAGCTPSWAIMFTKELEKKKVLKGLKVIDVKKALGLFDKTRPKRIVSREYSLYNISGDKLVKILEKVGKEYAFTTFFAENVLQEYLFLPRTDIYVKAEDLEEWHKELIRHGTYGGGNVRLLVAENDQMFNRMRRKQNQVWTVSFPQLICDLYKEKGPAVEAANMLLEKIEKTLEKRE